MNLFEVQNAQVEDTITWYKQPIVFNILEDTQIVPSFTTPIFIEWNIVSLLRDWLSEKKANYGVMIKSIEESFQDGAKGFCSSDWIEDFR